VAAAEYASPARQQHSREDSQKRRLAGPILAYEYDDFPRPHIKANSTQRVHAAEALVHIAGT
jgi:hypothetical protein